MRRVPFALLLLALCFLLRVFYASLVWADEGLWFTAGQEILRGKILYREIWFDKPPALALVYVLLFAPGVAQLAVVRLATILYAFAVSLFLWKMGRTFWGEAEGRTAALLYAFYNATYLQSQVQPLAADHLMLLPYLASGFLYLRGRPLWGGLLASLAFQLNPKAAALGLFLVLYELIERRARPIAIYAAGFIAGSLPWLAYLTAGGKWPYYVDDFWGWGTRYVSVYSPLEWLKRGAVRTFNYAGFHLPLVVGSAFAGKDLLWLWLAASFAGVAAGGRFFPRYYFQVLPLLCLLAARGYHRYRQSSRSPLWGYLMLAGLLLSTVRFHTRTAVLAYETITGRSTSYMAAWDDTAIDRDSRAIARRIGTGTLFVWGYRPEIYFYCNCPPASPFLSSQPLTGVSADVHLRESTPAAAGLAARNRELLAAELGAQPPEVIVDGLGPYNPALAMEVYPELRRLLETHYEREPGETGHGWIFRKKRK